MSGRDDRKSRLLAPKGGASASDSQDYMCLCNILFEQSASYAARHDGNVSIFPIAGIPLLFSAIRALLIECHSGIYGIPKTRNESVLKQLARDSNEIDILKKEYGVSGDAVKNLLMLYEVRNEIVHPSNLPTGTPNNTPVYLGALRDAGVLQSTGVGQQDFHWLAQLHSHRLFRWGFEQIENISTLILTAHHADPDSLNTHKETYARYRHITN